MFLTARTAVLLDVQVSFDQIVVSAIVGSDFAVGGGAAVSPRKLGVTVLARIGSFALEYHGIAAVGAV